MATFVSLINWTDQGISGFRDTGKRFDAFAELVEKRGGSVRSCFWTVGPYDIVATFDVPDDETGTAILLEVGSLGNIRSTTLRAFDRGEMDAIIDKTR